MINIKKDYISRVQQQRYNIVIFINTLFIILLLLFVPMVIIKSSEIQENDQYNVSHIIGILIFSIIMNIAFIFMNYQLYKRKMYLAMDITACLILLIFFAGFFWRLQNEFLIIVEQKDIKNIIIQQQELPRHYYLVGMLVSFMFFTCLNLIINYVVKLVLSFGLILLSVVFINDWDHETFYMLMLLIILLGFSICYLIYTNIQQLYSYLDQLQVKIKEERVLQQQMQKAKDNDRMRQIMVGSISHEIRTPLNSLMIQLKAAQLCFSTNSKLNKKFLIPAINSSEYLLLVINDMLDYTQISFNKKPRMVYEVANIKETINWVIQVVQLKASMKNIPIKTVFNQDLPMIFYTDPRRLKQVLFNLIGNAIKFTFQGSITINASCIKVNNINAIQISVIDTGFGIAEEDQSKLFKQFSMIEDSKGYNKTGSGLGLYISNSYVKELGFKNNNGIEVKSKRKVGSTFSFTLENKVNSSERVISGYEIQLPYVFHQIRYLADLEDQCKHHAKILIVDDDGMNAYALQLLLEQLRYTSEFALTGKDAIKMVVEREEDQSCSCQYQIILLDCNMPIFSGYETCIELKQLMDEKEIRQILIIACSADATELNLKRCKSIKFDNFMEKPVQLKKLRAVLSKIQLH